MRWALLGLGILVLLVVVVVVVGLLLPKGHLASGQASLRAKPEAVFAILTDFAGGAGWRTGITRVEMLPPRDGKIAFKESGPNGEMAYVVEESIAPTRLVTRVVDQATFGGTWTYELKPDAGGTRLTITERGEVYNPIFRFMSRFFFSPAATIEKYLADLQRRCD